MNESLKMGRSYLNSAFRRQTDADECLKKFAYDKSIRESQECIEFAIKAIFYAFDIEPPKSHNFTEDNFKLLLSRISSNSSERSRLSLLEFQKPYLYSRFWGSFYEIAKYGLEKMGVGPGNLFGKEEAELALGHARYCTSIANAAVHVYAPEISMAKEAQ